MKALCLDRCVFKKRDAKSTHLVIMIERWLRVNLTRSERGDCYVEEQIDRESIAITLEAPN